ncbi:MAG TPA: hypothetical protein VGO00_23315 [Kofleriaceae bacterium]|jgi:hypothetical protein|nr:hypothetical protein [Kofleriaceae bacterium]
MRRLALFVVLATGTASADPAPPSEGWIAGAMIGIDHVEDKTDSESLSGTGPVIEIEGGRWLNRWLAGTLFVAFSTIGTDTPYQLSDGSYDHLRQYDVSFGVRLLLRVSEAFSFGPAVGSMYDDRHFIGLQTSSTSRFYELDLALTPTYFGHRSLQLDFRAGIAPFYAGTYPVDYLILGVGAKL